jgi:hypothetical protein
MVNINDSLEELKKIAEHSDKAISWASTSAFKRISFLLLMNIILLGIGSFYLTDLANKVSTDINQQTALAANLRKSNLLKSSMEDITLCQNAIEKSTSLEEWYCDGAIKSYKNRLSNEQRKRSQELINIKAYGAMKADLAEIERYIKYDELINRKETKEQQLLNKILSSTGIVIILCLLIFFYGFAVYILHKKSRSDVEKTVVDRAAP